ncbi:MAG: DUF2779 domain-containing protein [Deinococcales bacterium]
MGKPVVTERSIESWLQCERRAWLEQHRPDLRAPDGGLEAYLVEQHADLRRLYEDRVARGDTQAVHAPAAPQAAAKTTTAALRSGAHTVLAAAFEAPVGAGSSLRMRARITGLRRAGDGWNLETLAAGTRVRAHHIRHLAFVKHVAERAKVRVLHALVLRAAPLPGAAGATLQATDVTAACESERVRLPARILAVAASLTAAHEPATGVGQHCYGRRPCPFIRHCWQPYDRVSIFHVRGLRRSTVAALRAAGWFDARTVPPATAGLDDAERTALEDVRNGRVRVDFDELARALGELVPPIAYLDMEFCSPAVPWLPEMAPFEHLPFQFSVHLETGDGRIEHVGHLHRDAGVDPRPALAVALAEALRTARTVVVYDASAEGPLLHELAIAEPHVAAALEAAEQRTWDLLRVVRETVRHPGFGTRWGLKRVASTLSPDSYQGVSLVDGLAAQAMWRRMLRSKDRALGVALERYCEADSHAMLGIVRVLRAWLAQHAIDGRERP